MLYMNLVRHRSRLVSSAFAMKISVLNICCSIPAILYLCMCLRAEATGLGIEVTGNMDYVSLFRNLREDFNSHELGCPDLSGPVDAYTWRSPGYGSNVNIMMLPWVRALVLGRKDLALVVGAFGHIDCVMENYGARAVGGFSCLFAAMPHLCIFESKKDWEHFMIERNVSSAEREDALRRDHVKGDWAMVPEIENHLKDSNVDIISAMAATLDYFHSHWQPWLKKDIQSILDEPAPAAVLEVPYISLHVRRGDKLTTDMAHDVKEYLEAARSYITNSTDVTETVEDIKGIWVSSDDDSVLSDVKEASAEFFPSVELENIVWISNHSLTNDSEASEDNVPTRTKTMHYGSYVVFFAELKALTEGSVFVGTFTSNVGRMLVLLREAKGLPRSSTISIDHPTWHPGRRALLTE